MSDSETKSPVAHEEPSVDPERKTLKRTSRMFPEDIARIVLGSRNSEPQLCRVENQDGGVVRERRSCSTSQKMSSPPKFRCPASSPPSPDALSPGSDPSSPPPLRKGDLGRPAVVGPRFSLGVHKPDHQTPTLEEVVCKSELSKAFGIFLTSIHASEGLQFLLDAAQVESEPEPIKRAELATSVFERFIRTGAESEINLSGAIRGRVTRSVAENPAALDIFAEAEQEIRLTLGTVLLSDWLATGEWKHIKPLPATH